MFVSDPVDLVTDQMWRINQSNALESRAKQRMSDQSQSLQVLLGDQWIHRYSQKHRERSQWRRRRRRVVMNVDVFVEIRRTRPREKHL